MGTDESGEWVVQYPQKHDCRPPGKMVSAVQQNGLADKWRCASCQQVWSYGYYATFRASPQWEWHRDLPVMDDTGRQWKHPHNMSYLHSWDPEYGDPGWEWVPEDNYYRSTFDSDQGEWRRKDPTP